MKKVMTTMFIKPESFYPELIQDYFSGALKDQNIFQLDYEESELLERIKNRQFQERKLLTEALIDQYSNVDKSPSVLKNIDLLKKPNTFTVCTGHQLSLFGGPAYFFTKIIEVIRLAEELNKKQSEAHVVPVFWMATEDHDFEEVSTVELFNEQFKWEEKCDGMVGELNCSSLQGLLEKFCDKIGQGDHAEQIIAILKKAYSAQHNLALATRMMVNELFGDKGLIIIDGNDPRLKQLLTPVFSAELFEQIVKEKVNEQISKLHCYKIQANPRDINIFYLQNNYRVRIEQSESGFKTADNRFNWTKEEIQNELQSFPKNFSPNVFLRPVYQELCLPNVAYVGGAGEISYWLELPLLFEALNVAFPLPIVRNSFVYLNAKQISQVKELGLRLEDLFKREDLLINDYVAENSNKPILLTQELKELEDFFDKISEKAVKIDKNLEKVVAGEFKRVNSGLENLEKRFRNAEKNNFEQKISQIKNLRSKIFPDDVFQERKLSFLEFYLKSQKDLFEQVRKETIPLENSLKVLVL